MKQETGKSPVTKESRQSGKKKKDREPRKKRSKQREKKKKKKKVRPDPGHLGLQGYSIYITNLAIFSLQGPAGKRVKKRI